MRHFILIVFGVVLAAVVAAPLARAERAPGNAIVLDFTWLTPPLIAPDIVSGNVVRMGDFVRLSSRAGTIAPSFTWSMRYPINIDQYPILVMRYRASSLKSAGEPVLSLEMEQVGTIVPVISAADISDDGQVRAIRKDLRQLPPGSTAARFRLALPAAAQLDVMELAFETPDGAVPALVPMRQNVQFNIVNEYSRPLAAALVRAGPLERRNWSTQARTDARGNVSLDVISAAAASEPSGMLGLVEPTEAAITRAGYAAQYVSSIPSGSVGVISVAMRERDVPVSAQLPPEASAPQQTQYDHQAEVPGYSPPAPDDYYYDRRGYYDSQPYYGGGGYYPYGGYGYAPVGYVFVSANDPNRGNGDGQENGMKNEGKRVVEDFRTAPLEAPPASDIMVPWPGQTSVASRGVTTVARYGVTTVPQYGAITVPSQGVITVPRQGVTTVPRSPTVGVPSGFQPLPAPAAPRASSVAPSPRRDVMRSPMRVGPQSSARSVMTGEPRSSMAPVRTQIQAAPARFAPAPPAASGRATAVTMSPGASFAK